MLNMVPNELRFAMYVRCNTVKYFRVFSVLIVKSAAILMLIAGAYVVRYKKKNEIQV